MERLLRLDREATNKGTMTALILGILGALILGLGMSCVMAWGRFNFGIPVGVV